MICAYTIIYEPWRAGVFCVYAVLDLGPWKFVVRYSFHLQLRLYLTANFLWPQSQGSMV